MAEPDGLEALVTGFADALEQALVTADQNDAERVTRDALRAGLPASLIDDHVVRPAMRGSATAGRVERSRRQTSSAPPRSCFGC